jgi:hypothetical protein
VTHFIGRSFAPAGRGVVLLPITRCPKRTSRKAGKMLTREKMALITPLTKAPGEGTAELNAQNLMSGTRKYMACYPDSHRSDFHLTGEIIIAA